MKIYPVMIEMVKAVHGLSRKMQQHEPDLAQQIRRYSSRVHLNAVVGWFA